MADLLYRADTLSGLAKQLGLPPDNLKEAVERFNAFAREERDPDFHGGESAYDPWWGFRANPNHKHNPTLGPLEKPPFYGLQFHLGTVGNLGGLVTNANAQVISVQGEVIPGLYGTSNTTAILSHGCGYDSGSCQGKSMIFGYNLVHDMIKGLQKFMERKGYEDPSDFIGIAQKKVPIAAVYGMLFRTMDVPFRKVVNEELCNGCGLCVGGCLASANGAIQVRDGIAQIDEATCTRCNVCEIVCPTGAILTEC